MQALSQLSYTPTLLRSLLNLIRPIRVKDRPYSSFVPFTVIENR